MLLPQHPPQNGVSIHALRVEGDLDLYQGAGTETDFNPRPPCGGRLARVAKAKELIDISIHALRVEGDRQELARSTGTTLFSIHALRVEGDAGAFR